MCCTKRYYGLVSTSKGLIALNPVSHKSAYIIRWAIAGDGNKIVQMSPKGILWVSTGGHGVLTFDMKSKKFTENFRNYLMDPYSICSNNIVSLYFDSVGNIWCGSFGNGVSYANVESRFFSKYLSKDEMDALEKGKQCILGGADQKGNIWCILQDVLGFWLLDSRLKVKEFRKPYLRMENLSRDRCTK